MNTGGGCTKADFLQLTSLHPDGIIPMTILIWVADGAGIIHSQELSLLRILKIVEALRTPPHRTLAALLAADIHFQQLPKEQASLSIASLLAKFREYPALARS